VTLKTKRKEGKKETRAKQKKQQKRNKKAVPHQGTAFCDHI